MKDRPYLAPVAKGWKKRQLLAEQKFYQGQSREERQRIADIRRENRIREEERARAERLGITEESSQPENDSSAEVNDDKVWSDEEPSDDVDSMDRDALVAALVEAGEKKPHPNTKLETLRKKVRELN